MSTFRVIRAEERTASLIEWFSGICQTVTDFIVGSKIRSQFETIAVEMEAQDFQFLTALKKAIPTALYSAFDFTLIPAVKANGNVTFTASPAPTQDIVIPAGTTLETAASATAASLQYVTTAVARIIAGQTTVSAPVAATEPGAAFNTAANTVNMVSTAIPGVASVTNPLAIEGGRGQETEGERRLRFLLYVNSLSKGVNDALLYGATQAALYDAQGVITERVLQAYIPPSTTEVIGIPGPSGYVYLYIYNGVDGASAGLIARTQEILDGYYLEDGSRVIGYKAAGVIVTVIAATLVPQAVTVEATLTDTADQAVATAAIEEVITSYFSEFGISESFIYNELVSRIMGVADVLDISLTAPATNVTANYDEVLTLGTVTVTYA